LAGICSGGGIHSDQAFVWTESTGMTPLGPLPGDVQSVPVAISENGLVVLGWSSNAFGEDQLFRWTRTSGIVGLGQLPGHTPSTVTYRGMSADGGVVVGYSNDASGFGGAFRWTEASGMVALPPLPGDWRAFPNDVSPDGSTITGSSGGVPGTVVRWDDQLAVHSILDDLAAKGSALPATFRMSDPTIVDARGKILQGLGGGPDRRVWLAWLE
jgi:probable HAF family extracellular repeat protein